MIARLLTPAGYQRFGFDLAVASVASELAQHAAAPNPVGSFFFWNRTRREIALSPYAMVNGVRRSTHPFWTTACSTCWHLFPRPGSWTTRSTTRP